MAKMRDKDRRSFKEATSKMTNSEKVSHIWAYYKWPILGSMAGALLIFSFIHAFLTRTETYLNITFVSGFEHTLNALGPLDSDVIDESIDTLEIFPEPPVGIWVDLDIIPVLEALFLDDEQLNNYDIAVQHLGINFETIPVFTTHTGAGVMDIIVTYIPDAHAMAEIGHFKNLSELGWDLPSDKMHNEYTVYLRYFPIFDDYVAAPDDLVLGISINTRQLEHVEHFFETLLD